jgi:hypothetical protein
VPVCNLTAIISKFLKTSMYNNVFAFPHIANGLAVGLMAELSISQGSYVREFTPGHLVLLK